MANTFRWMLLTSLAQFALSSSISSRADVVTCVETTSANVFANPSWEDGTVTGGWQYNWPVTTTDAYCTDGSKSLTFTGNTIAGARLIRQTVSGLQVGTPYNVSVDFKAVVNPAYTLQFNKVYTRSDDTWNTYGGTFIPASSSLEIGWVLACSNSYAASIFNVYFDNAVVDATVQQCTTATPTPETTPDSSSSSSIISNTASSLASSIYVTTSVSSAALSSLDTHITNTTAVPLNPTTIMSPFSNAVTATPIVSRISISTTSSLLLPTLNGNANSTFSVAALSVTQPASSQASLPTSSTSENFPTRLNITNSLVILSTLRQNSSSLVNLATQPTSLPVPSNITTVTSQPTPGNFTSRPVSSRSSAAPSNITTAEHSAVPALSTRTFDPTTLSHRPTSSGAALLNSTRSSSATSFVDSPTGPPTDGTQGFPTITLNGSSPTSASPSNLVSLTTTFPNTTVLPPTVASHMPSSLVFLNSTGSATTVMSASLRSASPAAGQILVPTPSHEGFNGSVTTTGPMASTPLPDETETPASSGSEEQLTTLIVLATSTHTVLSCAPSITNCPANPASLTNLASSAPEQVSTILLTETIALTTTICPVTAAESISSSIISAAAVTGQSLLPSPTASTGEALTTLTVLTTSIHTVVGCAPTVTNCPASSAIPASLPEGVSTALVTETIALSTTVCPVTAAAAVSSSVLSAAAAAETFTAPVPSQVLSGGGVLTTLTVRATLVRTTVSCAATVTSCPDGRNTTGPPTKMPEGVSNVLVTETIELSTTVCPVTAAESILSSILSVAARGGITGNTIVPSATAYHVSGQSATPGVGSGATLAAYGQAEPMNSASSGITSIAGAKGFGEGNGGSGTAIGTDGQTPSAPDQTSKPSMLETVARKPCMRSQ